MAEESIEIIRIDDLLKATRRCTLAAAPSLFGVLPALAFAYFSLFQGILSFVMHAAAASAVVAGHLLISEGRVLGSILQLGGIGALTLEVALYMQQRADAKTVWLFVAMGTVVLLWGVFVTVRYQSIASRHPLAKSDLSPHGLFWRKARAVGLRRWKQISLTALLGAVIVITALGISVVLSRRLEQMYDDYSTRTHVLGILAYVTYMYLSGKWAQRLFFKARRLGALGADTLLEIDRRQPSLLLRSFGDDLTPLTPQFELGRQYVGKVVDVTPEQLTLEETISSVLSEFGPVIAVGRPGENLPPVGAARQYVPSENWQDSVAHLMTQARWIAIVLGKTEGLGVEYKQLRELGQVHKAIVVFPPVGAPDIEMRWKTFTATVLRTDFLEDLKHPRVAVIPDGQRPILIASKVRDEQGYELAMRRALGVLLQEAGGGHTAAVAKA